MAHSALDAAFEQLFTEYQGPILSYLYRMVGDAGRAEELAQDVFVRAYGALERLPEDANRRAWLYRIATNAAYDHLRHKRLIQWLPLLDHDTPSQAEGEEDRFGGSEAVQRALGQMPPQDRALLVLFCVEEHSIREISEIMGLTEGAVKTRLYRAREKFRQVYRPE